MASPSVLAMLLIAKQGQGQPLDRFEAILTRNGIEILRQALARWVIQCYEHFQSLLNLMRDRLLESLVIHCRFLKLANNWSRLVRYVETIFLPSTITP